MKSQDCPCQCHMDQLGALCLVSSVLCKVYHFVTMEWVGYSELMAVQLREKLGLDEWRC